MLLSDISVKRPVFATVFALLLVAIGAVSFTRLALREYPDVDAPIVNIRTSYPGASANVVESRITQLIEDQISGVEGIRFINSVSSDGVSNITIEFDVNRDIDAAANDVRDRVSGVARSLPEEADPPEVQKADAGEEVVLWLNVQSTTLSPIDLTDYVERFLVDRYSAIDGVARVQLAGARTPGMRIWVDRRALAARGLTVADIEAALRRENVEAPAGSLESSSINYTVRIDRAFRTAEDFAGLVIAEGADGYLIRLGDVARVEFGAVEYRNMFRGNGQQMVGLGIVKQSTANVVDVAKAARELTRAILPNLPEGMLIETNYDGSVFVDASIKEVYITLTIAVALVILVIFLFLGSLRATLIPAVTVPISLIATFAVLYALGLSINLLTLLALVLAIGLVVDDAIVVLENIHRRIEEEGETPLVAAYRGTRQVGFAVVATTLVLMAVFVPITFMQGQAGRLFGEFAVAISAAVGFSMIVALSLAPMLSSRILKPHTPGASRGFAGAIDRTFERVARGYGRLLDLVIGRPIIVGAVFLAALAASLFLFRIVPSEYLPEEDRGQFQIQINGPEGASYDYMLPYLYEIENRLLPLVEKGELDRIVVRAPGFGPGAGFSQGNSMVLLPPWGHRENGFDTMRKVNGMLQDLPGVRVFAAMRSSLGGRGGNKPVQFVIGGPSYEKLMEWRDTFLDAIEKENPGITAIDWDYKETQQQYRVKVNYDRAADLGVTVAEIGSTLQTMLGSRRIGTFLHEGEERDIYVEGERAEQSTPTDLQNIYVRSARSRELIPLSNLVTVEPMADSRRLNRYNRVRAITIDAALEPGVSLGTALDGMEAVARKVLPEEAVIDFKGQSLDYKRSGGSIGFIFGFGVVVVFLVLAAQFENWIHPIVIMLCVPFTVGGGVVGLWLTGGTLNLYTQIGLIMLVGLAAKNGILIVEFANQLRDEGVEFMNALKQAALTRLRPILMTSLTAMAGAVPLIFSHGAGSETRSMIGVVIFFGVLAAIIVSLVLVPVAYALLARKTGSPKEVERRLEAESLATPDRSAHPAE